MADAPRLVDIRNLGPNGERDISGKCSACGVILLTRLNDLAEATPNRLRDKLEKLFARHVTEKHIGR
jgi:hypothetical protein